MTAAGSILGGLDCGCAGVENRLLGGGSPRYRVDGFLRSDII